MTPRIRSKRAHVSLGTAAALAGIALVAASPSLRGQDWSVETLERGRITESLESRADPTERFALFLPSTYDPLDPPPVVLVIGTGNALMPVRRIRDTAQRLGYMVVSPHSARSDDAVEPNRKAVNAVLQDLQSALPGRMDRLYLVGFSGTARLAWSFGYQLAPNVAGIIALGAGMPEGYAIEVIVEQYGTPFGFYGGVGEEDFNYDELVLLRPRLEALDFPFRIDTYGGPHAWPGPEVFRSGLDWLTARAVMAGDPEPYGGFLQEVFDRELAAARSLAENERPLDAWNRATEVADLLTGRTDVSAARELSDRLSDDPALAEQTELRAQSARAFFDHGRAVSAQFASLRRADPLPTLETSLEVLEIETLRRARSEADPALRLLAERMWGSVLSYASFYEPRRFLDRGELDRASAALDIAFAMDPAQGTACRMRARLLSLRDDPAAALEQLECALTAGWPLSVIESDPDLGEVRALPGYGELVRRFGGEG